MKVIIIDDEIKSCESIKIALERNCKQANIAGIATSADAALQLITKELPDIIFLDVEMPGKNGFELLEAFHIKNFEVIFTTAHANYAVDAFRVNAVDYVLKPFTEKEIAAAFQKAEMRIREKISAKYASMQNQDNTKNTILPLPTSDGFEFVDVSEIMRCEAEDSYTWFYMQDKSKLLVSGNLHSFEAQLESFGFHRIHHSHMVNIAYVKKYIKGRGGYVIMSDGTSINVSVRKKAEFFEKLMPS